MIAFWLVFCGAQTATEKAPEPDTIGVFFYLDSATQTLKRLPQEDFKRHSGGFASLTQSVRVSGDASSFRFSGNNKTTLGFKVFKDEQAAGAELFQFNVKGSESGSDLGKWE